MLLLNPHVWISLHGNAHTVFIIKSFLTHVFLWHLACLYSLASTANFKVLFYLKRWSHFNQSVLAILAPTGRMQGFYLNYATFLPRVTKHPLLPGHVHVFTSCPGRFYYWTFNKMCKCSFTRGRLNICMFWKRTADSPDSYAYLYLGRPESPWGPSIIGIVDYLHTYYKLIWCFINCH